MSAAMISRIVSLIPERVARVQSGASFNSAESRASRYPERVSHLAQFLSWLSPLNAISKDDQHILGLLHANGRPVHANETEDEGDELEDGGADALEYVEAETAVGAAEEALLPHEQEKALLPREQEMLVPREEALA